MLTGYTILNAASIHSLAASVLKYAKDEWVLHGSPYVRKTPTGGFIHYQAMVKYTERNLTYIAETRSNVSGIVQKANGSSNVVQVVSVDGDA